MKWTFSCSHGIKGNGAEGSAVWQAMLAQPPNVSYLFIFHE